MEHVVVVERGQNEHTALGQGGSELADLADLADLAEIIGVAVAGVIRRGLRPVPPDPAALAATITCAYRLPARAR